MTENGPKIIVHPIAGVDFRMVPNGVAMTLRYYVKSGSSPSDEAKPNYTSESVTVGLTAIQAGEIAASLQRAVQIIEQPNPGPNN
jgi:hypothetical protein